jgi:hypothetical protein
MDEFIKAFAGTFTIPLWVALSAIFASVAIGYLCTIWAIHVTKVRYKGQVIVVEGDRMVSPSAPLNQRSESVPLHTSRKAKPDEAIYINAQGWEDLEKRLAQRLNYRINDVALLLGVPLAQVRTWLAQGRLTAIIMGDRIQHITAESVWTLLEQKGITRQDEPLSPVPLPSKQDAIKQLQDKAPPLALTQKDTAPAASTPYQPYRYYLDGQPTEYRTLKDVLAAAGLAMHPGDMHSWATLSSAMRKRIRRESAIE